MKHHITMKGRNQAKATKLKAKRFNFQKFIKSLKESSKAERIQQEWIKKNFGTS